MQRPGCPSGTAGSCRDPLTGLACLSRPVQRTRRSRRTRVGSGVLPPVVVADAVHTLYRNPAWGMNRVETELGRVGRLVDHGRTTRNPATLLGELLVRIVPLVAVRHPGQTARRQSPSVLVLVLDHRRQWNGHRNVVSHGRIDFRIARILVPARDGLVASTPETTPTGTARAAAVVAAISGDSTARMTSAASVAVTAPSPMSMATGRAPVGTIPVTTAPIPLGIETIDIVGTATAVRAITAPAPAPAAMSATDVAATTGTMPSPAPSHRPTLAGVAVAKSQSGVDVSRPGTGRAVRTGSRTIRPAINQLHISGPQVGASDRQEQADGEGSLPHGPQILDHVLILRGGGPGDYFHHPEPRYQSWAWLLW